LVGKTARIHTNKRKKTVIFGTSWLLFCKYANCFCFFQKIVCATIFFFAQATNQSHVGLLPALFFEMTLGVEQGFFCCLFEPLLENLNTKKNINSIQPKEKKCTFALICRGLTRPFLWD
jgi:hypothetical protein